MVLLYNKEQRSRGGDISGVFLILIILELGTLSQAVSCSSCRTSDRSCDIQKTRTASRQVKGWWWRRKTQYYSVYYNEASCCSGYDMENGQCIRKHNCGGCTGSYQSLPACSRYVTRYGTQYYSCGNRLCTRATTRSVYQRYCCTGYTRTGSTCIRKVATPAPTTPRPTLAPTTTQSPSGVCGTSVVQPGGLSQIVGGTDAFYGEFPWQVSLRKSSHFCGGTIIGDRWVLTAAHCVKNVFRWDMSIRIGDNTMSKLEDHEKIIKVDAIYIHPRYDSSTFGNDIALLKTTSKIVFNDYVQPACLPTGSSETYVGDQVQITGWGRTTAGERGRNDRSSDVLQKATAVVQDMSFCSRFANQLFNILCGSDTRGDTSTSICFGDSGGPMTLTTDNVVTVIGVASFVLQGCAVGYPFGYTNVSPYINWINGLIDE